MKIFHLGLYLKYMLRLIRATQCKQCKLEIYNKPLTILGWIWKYITCWIGSRYNFWNVERFWIVRRLLTNSAFFQLLISFYSF